MKSSKIVVTVGREKLASDKEEQVYSGGALDILAEVPPSTKHDFVLMLQLLEQRLEMVWGRSNI